MDNIQHEAIEHEKLYDGHKTYCEGELLTSQEKLKLVDSRMNGYRKRYRCKQCDWTSKFKEIKVEIESRYYDDITFKKAL